jgi:hypothetical protein
MSKKMMSVSEVSNLINEGHSLYVSGSENCLKQLPKGNWIGGTISYFMANEGGVVTHEKLLVIKFTNQISKSSIVCYDESDLYRIPMNYMPNGFSLIIIPAFSNILLKYANECTTWPGIFNQPLVGWVSGIDITTNDTPKVVNGLTGEFSTNKALVIHAELQPEFEATANIINIFEPNEGDAFTFQETGFEAETAMVNGKEVSLFDYFEKYKIDLKLPLVANYQGAMINVSIRDIDPITRKVRFYAPLFPGVTYRQAKAFESYEKEFDRALINENIGMPLFSCNCVLNFLYANLEGKKAGDVLSPMTFGEIAYMVLNQTFVYLTVRTR